MKNIMLIVFVFLLQSASPALESMVSIATAGQGSLSAVGPHYITLTAPPVRTVKPLINDSVQSVPAGMNELGTQTSGWNILIGISEINLLRSPRGESTMNNLICDIMRWRTDTDFAFITFGEIHADFDAGPITNIDLFRLVPFDRTLVVLEVNGEFLQKLVEYNISGIRQGMAIAGGKVEFDLSRPSLHRLNYFQVGEYPCYPQKEYKIVTIDYLAAGHAGFDMLTTVEPAKVFKTGILLRDAVQEYIRLNSPLNTINVKLDGRWEKRVKPTD